MTRARDNAFYGDINGNELILDADGDTSITSDTDDQIDIKVGGSDKVVIDSSGNVTISANLTVNGTTTTINSTTLSVDDKNIELGSVSSPDDTTADGGGITLKGATDHTFNWVNSTDAWTSSEHLNLASGKEFKINGTTTLSATQVLGKSLPSGDVIGTTDTQTLTNKTLTTEANTLTSGGNALTTLQAVYPVGSVYINAAVTTNPATLLGFGTWVDIGGGRVLVGQDAGDTDFDTLQETGGAKTHTLTVNEIPSHTHTIDLRGNGENENVQTPSASDNSDPNMTATTDATGGGAAHNNLQPYIVVKMWRRTA